MLYKLVVMNIFETLADPTRRHIVELLADGECSVGELCGEFEISQPAISRHLRVLRDAGLVARRTDAQRRMYSLKPGPFEEIDRWLERYSSFWRRRLDDLESALLVEDREEAKQEKRLTKRKVKG